MPPKTRQLKSAVVAVGLGCAVVAGVLFFRAAFARGIDQAGPYPKNQSGETYGSLLDAPSPDLEPDLIAAIGVDGTEGYVRATELYSGPLPKSPDEAVAYMKALESAPYSVRKVPLYAADGKTVIGYFQTRRHPWQNK